MNPAVRTAGTFTALILFATPALAQGWAADLYVGRALYDLVAANVGTSNLVAGLRHNGNDANLFYLAAAAPLGSDAPWWGAVGGIRRVPLLRRAVVTDVPAVANGTDGLSAALAGATGSAGIGLGGHGYAFRDPVADASGYGATIDAGGYARLDFGSTSLETRAAWLQHESSFLDENTSRSALDFGARVEHTERLRLGADARVVRTDEGAFPAISGDVTGATGALSAWVAAEQWLASDMQDSGWGAGAAVDLGIAAAWVSFRSDARDPLYWNPARRNWTLGVTWRPGNRSAPPRMTPITRNGAVVLRLPASAASSQISVAGDFSDWNPIPMRRTGRDWELELNLETGVYRYSFVDADGRWFVPDAVPGRMADGMGGYVAVLVIP